MSALDAQTPPAGEDIHLPGPSLLPLFTGIGITLSIIGITTIFALTVIGVVLTIVCVVRWVRSTRREIDELPLDAHQ